MKHPLPPALTAWSAGGTSSFQKIVRISYVSVVKYTGSAIEVLTPEKPNFPGEQKKKKTTPALPRSDAMSSCFQEYQRLQMPPMREEHKIEVLQMILQQQVSPINFLVLLLQTYGYHSEPSCDNAYIQPTWRLWQNCLREGRTELQNKFSLFLSSRIRPEE